MEDTLNTLEDTLASDELNVPPLDGLGTDDQTQEVVSVKDILSQTLGKDFKDDASALKAVKDTFDYVGKAGKYQKPIQAVREAKNFGNDEQAIKYIMENITPETAPAPVQPAPDNTRLDALEKELKETRFYAENPDLKPHADLIRSLGSDPYEVVSKDVFKNTVEKLKAYDEKENSKSVLHSNQRLGVVTDTLSQARQAASQGDHTAAAAKAIEAVNEAYSS